MTSARGTTFVKTNKKRTRGHPFTKSFVHKVVREFFSDFDIRAAYIRAGGKDDEALDSRCAEILKTKTWHEAKAHYLNQIPVEELCSRQTLVAGLMQIAFSHEHIPDPKLMDTRKKAMDSLAKVLKYTEEKEKAGSVTNHIQQNNVVLLPAIQDPETWERETMEQQRKLLAHLKEHHAAIDAGRGEVIDHE